MDEKIKPHSEIPTVETTHILVKKRVSVQLSGVYEMWLGKIQPDSPFITRDCLLWIIFWLGVKNRATFISEDKGKTSPWNYLCGKMSATMTLKIIGIFCFATFKINFLLCLKQGRIMKTFYIRFANASKLPTLIFSLSVCPFERCHTHSTMNKFGIFSCSPSINYY